MGKKVISANSLGGFFREIMSARLLVIFALMGLFLYVLCRFNYLISHIFMELSIAIIGILIFSASYMSRGIVKENLLILLGPGFLMTSLVAVLHTLAFKGMTPIWSSCLSRLWANKTALT